MGTFLVLMSTCAQDKVKIRFTLCYVYPGRYRRSIYRQTCIWRTTVRQTSGYHRRYAWSQSHAYQVFVICIWQTLHMTDQFSWSHWICHIQVRLNIFLMSVACTDCSLGNYLYHIDIYPDFAWLSATCSPFLCQCLLRGLVKFGRNSVKILVVMYVCMTNQLRCVVSWLGYESTCSLTCSCTR